MFLSETKDRSPRAQSKGRVVQPGRGEQRGQQHTHYKGRDAPKDAPAIRNASEDELVYEENKHDDNHHGPKPDHSSTRHLCTSSPCCVGTASRIAYRPEPASPGPLER